MARSNLSVLTVSLLFAACGESTQTPPHAPTTASVAPAASVEPPKADHDVSAPPAEAHKPKTATSAAKYTGLATPESVLYNADSDRYLVSNINGKPLDTDNNGFVAALSPEGSVITLKWIEGGKNKVKLDAPKGMAIAKGVLYVADITIVRTFDLKSGAPKGDIKIAGSTFLNDVAAGPDGKIYVSDSGLKAGATGFEPTFTDAVYVIDKGKAKALAKSPELGRPNGLLVDDKGVWVVTFGTGELYRLDDKGAKHDALKLPKGMLDGIVAAGDSLLISSWEGSAIFHGKTAFEVALPDQKAPADIGYDTKRGRVLVPHFTEDTVEAYELK